jgi:hypothetical protein
MAHDASATWSGFNYQGKVALFYTLFFINQKLDGDINYDFNGYSLTLERHEDFEIGNQGGPVSFHQVKAYKDADFSKYKNALLELSLELRDYPPVKGYLHTWQNIILPEGKNLVETVKDDIEKEVELYNAATNKDHTNIGKAFNGSTSPPKRAAILRNAFANTPGVNHQAVIQTLNEICAQDTGSVNRIMSYQYPDGTFACDLQTIEDLIKVQLELYFTKKAIINTNKQINNAYNYFLGMLDRHILERHRTLGKTIPLDIRFFDIIQILEKDFEDVSTRYLQFYFKDLFLKQLERFCMEPALCPNEAHSECDDEYNCNLRDITNLLFELPSEILWDYYKNFVPHKNLSHENNIVNALTGDLDAVLNTLFKVFFEINSDKRIDRYDKRHLNYSADGSTLNLYLPTAVGQAHPSTLARDIFNNQNCIEMLYEVKNIIVGDGLQQINNLHEALNLNKRSGSLNYPELDNNQKEKINDLLKDLRVVPLSTAKDEINVD